MQFELRNKPKIVRKYSSSIQEIKNEVFVSISTDRCKFTVFSESHGRNGSNYGFEGQTKGSFINFTRDMLTLKLQDCGDRPEVLNGNYIQPSKNGVYIDKDQLEVQCRKR